MVWVLFVWVELLMVLLVDNNIVGGGVFCVLVDGGLCLGVDMLLIVYDGVLFDFVYLYCVMVVV